MPVEPLTKMLINLEQQNERNFWTGVRDALVYRVDHGRQSCCSAHCF